jgi:hypothetical protein
MRSAFSGALAPLLATLAVVLGLSDVARADVPVGVAVGYAFRPAVVEDGVGGEADERNHGASASIVVDGPPLLWGFSGRLEGLVLGFSGPKVAASPQSGNENESLLVAGGGASVTYLFDDTAVAALASVGVVGAVVADGDVSRVSFGPLVGLTVRFPVIDGVNIDARVSVPLLADPAVPLVGTAMLGLSIAPDAIIAAALRGDGPAALAEDAGVPMPSFEDEAQRQ